MVWYLIFCSAAVYLGFAVLVGRIFATDARCAASDGATGHARGAGGNEPPDRSRIEDELQAQSWSQALHALYLPEAL